MAELSKEKLIEIKEKYLEAINLSTEVNETNPPTEPFKSKYAAKQIFGKIVVYLESLQESNAIHRDIELKKALINYEIGHINIETNDLSTAEINFESSLKSLDNIANRESCILLLNLYNSFGILRTKLQEITKAKDALIKAENVYEDYIKENCAEAPYLPEEIIYYDSEASNPNKAWEVLEIAHTHTHFYLAQVYEQLEEMDQSSKYLHKTIKKQLKHPNLDHIEWAINSATLSKYYLPKDKYKIAKHYLICSTHILSKYETFLTNTADDSEEKSEQLYLLKYCKAKVANHWVSYFISLLYCSANHLDDDPNFELIQPDLNEEQELISDPEIKKCQNIIPSELAKNYEEAKTIFLEAQKWIEDAKKHFILEEHASDHVGLVQNHSKLYNLLITFEKDPQNACKMHKRRADMLEPLLDCLNSQFYLVLCRLLMFELGEIFQAMMDLKLSILNKLENTKSKHAVNKINMLVKKSIHYFLKFIDSCKDSKTNDLPKPYPEEVAHALLVGHFYLGRLPLKYMTNVPKDKLLNLKLSQKYYQLVVDYTKEYPQHQDLIKEELKMTKEMLTLITSQIKSLSDLPQE